MFKNKAITPFLALAAILIIFAIGLFKSGSGARVDLKGRVIKASELIDSSGMGINLQGNSIVYIHTDSCQNCIADKILFDKISLKSHGQVFGVKLRDGASTSKNDYVFSNVYRAKSSDFFVELGVAFVPITLVVGSNGEIIYSHIGKLNIQKIEDEIIPLISSK